MRPLETRMGGAKVQKCSECLRLKSWLQESGLDYLAATNRYNTVRLTGLDSWASEVLRTAKSTNDAAQRQFDEHTHQHAQETSMTAGA